MAKEVVRNEVKTETNKKKGRRLKRSVRKTLGALFMATAIAVAAIPVDGLQAAPTKANDGNWGTLDENMPGASGIPKVENSERIYTTGDGKFQFAYVRPARGSSENKVAVILGYEKSGTLEGGALEIPNTVNAYARQSGNEGTSGGYTAISESGDFLYYAIPYQSAVIDSDTGKQKQNEDGTLVWETKYKYEPCYYRTINDWFYTDSAHKTERPLSAFYYYADNNPNSGDPLPTGDPSHQWIKNIDVRYIGNQYLIAEKDSSGNTTNWKIGGTVEYKADSNSSNGIFAGAGNIVTLTVGDQLSGIGDYAFYGCTNLKSITLNNGLDTIGVGAFANCVNMTDANIDVHSQVSVIGDYAFYSCRAMQSFTLPNQVGRIGNSAFENCRALTTFTMGAVTNGVQENGLLNNLGAHVFKDCSSLKNISFQSQFTEAIPLTTFQGCSSLEYIEVANSTIDFTAESGYSFDQFKADVLPTFYFKGIKDSVLHGTSRDNQVAFSFFDNDLNPARNIYELTVTEGTRKVVYRVDENDNLVFCGSGDSDNQDLPDTVNLPKNIGPYHIKVIDSQTFQNHCELKRISIPNSITGIEADAFKGCHQLEWVIFEDPNKDLTIGQHAFLTQETLCTRSTHTVVTSPDSPKLNFVGPISYDSAPFDYAMNPDEAIDNANQPTTYIKYYDLWPSLIAVQYNPEKDENELVDYPTLTDMEAYKKYTGTAFPYLNETDVNGKTKADVIMEAMDKYVNNLKSAEKEDKFDGMSTDEAAVVKAAINLVLPEGVEGIEKDLFVNNEGKDGIGGNFSGVEKTITAKSIIKIDDEAFKGHTNLIGITFSDATVSVGTHAFEGCTKLKSVSLPGTVEKMGTRPFAGCEKLSTVNFNGGPYFTCENSIIFELANGTKTKIVECLEGRVNPMIDAKETAGITGLYPEAFKNTGVITVDLSNSRISEVPESCFEDTRSLATVTLPSTINGGAINKNAFKKSAISVIRIPGQFINIDQDAFAESDHLNEEDHSLIFWCDEVKEGERNMAAEWAEQHGLTPEYSEPEVYYTVRFFYYDDDDVAQQIGQPQRVLIGHSAEAPDAPEKPGYTFEGYFPQSWKAVTGNVDTFARYKENDTEMFTVIFQDYNGKVLQKQTVAKGGSAIVPQSPSRMDEDPPWVFDGWVLSGGDGEFLTQQSSSLMNVQSDMVLIAQYHLAKDGETVDPGTGKTPSPSPGTSGSPGPGTSGSPNPGTSGSPGPGYSGTLYTLTVQNGSGSGSYVEGAQPVIIANNPATGQVFDYWSVSPEDVKIASTVLSASVITMPAKDVTVTAHYKAGSGNGSGSGSGGTGGDNNAQRPNGGSETVTKGGTTVVIDKNGLSNTGVVSATVNGSSDNFTIKITDTTEAAEAAVRALMAEYGDDLTNIRYFPMDISLYDSTGTYKITDTTGLSVDITIPLPDSMITYAGNNKVASTAGSRIERLDARFSTIQGVSCVTFTAEHFSPYMIYVDLGNLSSGLVSDETPKTGDGIHPKWFLSIGLACLSMVLFMQKDNRKQPKKVKVKVRAR